MNANNLHDYPQKLPVRCKVRVPQVHEREEGSSQFGFRRSLNEPILKRRTFDGLEKPKEGKNEAFTTLHGTHRTSFDALEGQRKGGAMGSRIFALPFGSCL